MGCFFFVAVPSLFWFCPPTVTTSVVFMGGVGSDPFVVCLGIGWFTRPYCWSVIVGAFTLWSLFQLTNGQGLFCVGFPSPWYVGLLLPLNLCMGYIPDVGWCLVMRCRVSGPPDLLFILIILKLIPRPASPSLLFRYMGIVVMICGLCPRYRDVPTFVACHHTWG